MSDIAKTQDDRRTDQHAGHPAPVASEAVLHRLSDALRGLRFGSVVAIVQDGVVVQIERTEKTRFGR
ncbi:MAG: YezD family protein [Pirellulales bacterium]